MTNPKDTGSRSKRSHLSLVSGSVTSRNDPAESHERHLNFQICTFCKKPIMDDEYVAHIEEQPYHEECQYIEYDRFAWTATKDAIFYGLGSEIRSVYPGGHTKLNQIRERLRDENIRYSDVLTVLMTISYRIRGSLDKCGFSKERRKRCDDNLTGLARTLSDFLKNR
ncbi:hypothetical protein IT408_00170 [Candidatus Uhrbacteria bacterium]|nr:hypothetical protein [Candidatus Uhrbacteria bacterium]